MVGYRVVMQNVESTDERLTSLEAQANLLIYFQVRDTCSWAADKALEKIIKIQNKL